MYHLYKCLVCSIKIWRNWMWNESKASHNIYFLLVYCKIQSTIKKECLQILFFSNWNYLLTLFFYYLNFMSNHWNLFVKQKNAWLIKEMHCGPDTLQGPYCKYILNIFFQFSCLIRIKRIHWFHACTYI